MFRPALLNKKLIAPTSWHAMPHTEAFKVAYEKELSPVMQKCFGYHLIKLGELSQALSLESCPIKHQVCHSYQNNPGAGLIAKATELPYKERSIDAILMTHVLDYASDPHRILREVDHCLIPSGHLIIVGFNPYSLAGLAKWLPVKKQNPVHDARFFSRTRVRDWLSLMGYQVTTEKRFLFSEMLFPREPKKPQKWQQLAQNHLSFFTSVYILVAKKQEFPLSLIKPVWKPVPKFSTVGASLRVKNDKC